MVCFSLALPSTTGHMSWVFVPSPTSAQTSTTNLISICRFSHFQSRQAFHFIELDPIRLFRNSGIDSMFFMSLNLLAAVALSLADTGLGVPVYPVTTNSTGISWHPAGNTQSTCDPSTFAESPTIDPADWRECASLYSSWTSENGTFRVANVDANGFTPILQTTDCTIGVKPANPSQGPFTIGDRDIKTLLDVSLRQYSEGTDLRVTGTVKCTAAVGSKGDVIWRISKS